MTVWFLIFFGSDLSKMDQTWSNFLARNSVLAVMAFLHKLLIIQKYLCQIWSSFKARKGFFQMNLPYFSKYWKVWLAFDGWKLSGLLMIFFLFSRRFFRKFCPYLWLVFKSGLGWRIIITVQKYLSSNSFEFVDENIRFWGASVDIIQTAYCYLNFVANCN